MAFASLFALLEALHLQRVEAVEMVISMPPLVLPPCNQQKLRCSPML